MPLSIYIYIHEAMYILFLAQVPKEGGPWHKLSHKVFVVWAYVKYMINKSNTAKYLRDRSVIDNHCCIVHVSIYLWPCRSFSLSIYIYIFFRYLRWYGPIPDSILTKCIVLHVIIPHLYILCLDPGILDPGLNNLDPGSRIQDPQRRIQDPGTWFLWGIRQGRGMSY